jgi:hypothetical protein
MPRCLHSEQAARTAKGRQRPADAAGRSAASDDSRIGSSKWTGCVQLQPNVSTVSQESRVVLNNTDCLLLCWSVRRVRWWVR